MGLFWKSTPKVEETESNQQESSFLESSSMTDTLQNESQKSGPGVVHASIRPSRKEARMSSLLSESIHPQILNEYMQTTQVDILQQVMRVVSNNCMKHCQVAQFDPRSRKTNYPYSDFTTEQHDCIEKCGKKMHNAFFFIAEKYQERISAPGATVYLGLSENVASTFRG